ncbi:hypothetical protein, partial [Xanthomonas perforans]|uniref:hypothetical protein n=1 Tax=Xanthomonas perforans TaxID=442694 RepID=UPI0019D31392
NRKDAVVLDACGSPLSRWHRLHVVAGTPLYLHVRPTQSTCQLSHRGLTALQALDKLRVGGWLPVSREVTGSRWRSSPFPAFVQQCTNNVRCWRTRSIDIPATRRPSTHDRGARPAIARQGS